MKESYDEQLLQALSAAFDSDNAPGYPDDSADVQWSGLPKALAGYLSAEYSASSSQTSWCVMESPEGEYTRTRIFRKLRDVLAHLAGLEGTETVVAIVRGTPCRLSRRKNGKRYLHVNAFKSALISADDSASLVSRDSVAAHGVQDNGWLGDDLYLLDDSSYLEEYTDDDGADAL